MKRLSINEIKSDIKNGYWYLEYECNYYNGNMIIFYEPRESNVIIIYTRDNNRVTYAINSSEFMKMSREQFNKYFNEQWFYNAQEIE